MAPTRVSTEVRVKVAVFVTDTISIRAASFVLRHIEVLFSSIEW